MLSTDFIKMKRKKVQPFLTVGIYWTFGISNRMGTGLAPKRKKSPPPKFGPLNP
jgi:hypothetical protein